jgi:hypothetical protein
MIKIIFLKQILVFIKLPKNIKNKLNIIINIKYIDIN